MPKLVPEQVNINEYEPFTIAFTIECEPDEEPCTTPVITGITISDPSLPDNITDGIRIQILNNSIIATGVFADVFEREIHYIMPGNVIHIARAWSQIPENFETVIKYKGPMIREKQINFIVNTQDGDFSSVVNILNNFNVSNKYLIKYIKKGKY